MVRCTGQCFGSRPPIGIKWRGYLACPIMANLSKYFELGWSQTCVGQRQLKYVSTMLSNGNLLYFFFNFQCFLNLGHANKILSYLWRQLQPQLIWWRLINVTRQSKNYLSNRSQRSVQRFSTTSTQIAGLRSLNRGADRRSGPPTGVSGGTSPRVRLRRLAIWLEVVIWTGCIKH